MVFVKAKGSGVGVKDPQLTIEYCSSPPPPSPGNMVFADCSRGVGVKVKGSRVGVGDSQLTIEN